MFLTDIINKMEVGETLQIYGFCLDQKFEKQIVKISHSYQTLNIMIEHTEHNTTKVDKIRDTAIKHLLTRRILKLAVGEYVQSNIQCLTVQIDM